MLTSIYTLLKLHQAMASTNDVVVKNPEGLRYRQRVYTRVHSSAMKGIHQRVHSSAMEGTHHRVYSIATEGIQSFRRYMVYTTL